MNLFVFHRNLSKDMACLEAGVDGVVIDLESNEKHRRQCGFDTEINEHTMNDLHALRGETDAKIICRSNSVVGADLEELRAIVDGGADEILLPMVRTLTEVEAAIELTDGQCGLGVMIETPEAVERAETLDQFPLTRVFIGLNDLRICRSEPSIFHPIADGVVDSVRSRIQQADFGFGGLTVPGGGEPLEARHFFNEMARLSCDFTFLRRSFFRDLNGAEPHRAVAPIRAAIDAAFSRPDAAVEVDRTAFRVRIAEIVEDMNVCR